MPNMTGDEIRETFLRFFESKDHLRVASSSLIPVGDPTLLLTNAGMVQFKPYFSGDSTPPNRRLTSSQKSFRTVDIDEVGDKTHLTMFEMLGNFSIGDYFKEGAIDFALECLATAMGLPQERFAITVHDTDDDAFELWRKVGVPAGRIYRFGDQDNWWGPPIHGIEGPCGPCSELHYDFGADKGCGGLDCGPNCANSVAATGETCDRFVELWNLVFMQFYRHPDGKREPLPAPGIDTGMGFERLALVLQGVSTLYETDLFTPLISRVEEISGVPQDRDDEARYATRVLAEHGRSASFLIADGVVPGNDGRGYVLRRVVRRAIRHGRALGIEGPFLGRLADVVVETMGGVYPELRNHKDFVQTVLRLEEEKFQQAFQSGHAVLSDALAGGQRLGGDVVFRLWDTYGFPVEMTEEIASEEGVEVDMEGFRGEMEAQRERGRAAGQFTGDRARIRVYEGLGVGATGFLGYEQLRASSVVVGMLSDGQAVDRADKGDRVEVALVETPFYAEGGGQVGDAGDLVGPNGKVRVTDTQEVMPGLTVHFGEVADGFVVLGDGIDAIVDPVRRQDVARNHTATHMLHAALRQVLGPHVRQAGSLVSPGRLRFDFSHVKAMTAEEIESVEWLVNEKIRENVDVHHSEDSYASAIDRGALAFFGDKYDDTVRLVEIANGATFSFEVCGGTHVHRTGELGAVYIMGESSIGSGMRRIEAVSGRGAERTVRRRLNVAAAAASALTTTVDELGGRIQGFLEELEEARRAREVADRRLAASAAEGLLDLKQDVGGVALIASRVAATRVEALREMGDWLRDRLGSGVVVLGTVVEERPHLIAMVTPDLVADGIDAAQIVRGAAKAIQGGGGGRPDVAQAGGRDADRLDEALGLVPGLLRRKGGAS